jgi:hypothetical protein
MKFHSGCGIWRAEFLIFDSVFHLKKRITSEVNAIINAFQEIDEMPESNSYPSICFIQTEIVFTVCVQMIPAVQQFIVGSMGHKYIEPPTFDLSLSYRESTHSTPLIFILSPGADPLAVLMKFAEEKGFYCHHCHLLIK